MANSTLLPNGEGTYQQWTNHDYSAIRSNDGDTSYIYAGRNDTVRESWTMENLPANAGPITEVKGRVNCRRSGTGGNSTYKVFCRASGGSVTDNPSGTGTTDSYVFNGYYVFATEPGGAGWTKAKVDAMQGGVYNIGPGDNTIRCTYCDFYVTYTPASTYFLLIPSLVLGLAVFPFFEDFARYADAWFRANPQHVLEASEYRRAFEDYRADRFARRFILPARPGAPPPRG